MITRRGTEALLGLTLIGLVLRCLRLDWQPLWWDEGYSVYFATETLGSMVWLTALDIHPPLYYAALHNWISAWGHPSPVALRTFSVVAGVAALPVFGWLAHVFFSSYTPVHAGAALPATTTRSQIPRSAIWIGLLLFVLHPLHIYYSQEVRMYGLALFFTLWSSAAFWRLLHRPSTPPYTALISYVLATTLALYTLYYSALIPMAHLAYAIYVFVRKGEGKSEGNRKGAPLRVIVTRVILAQGIVALLYLPWVIYAAGQLIAYVTDKIGADNDTPLSLPAYLGRHGLAFIVGHLPIDVSRLEQISILVGWILLGVAAVGLAWWFRRRQGSGHGPFARPTPEKAPESTPELNPITALWFLLLVPLTLGFLLNLRLPFFPVGGERLMLMVLPYFLLLVAAAIASIPRTWMRRHTLLLLLAIFAVSVLGFYTTPRHQDRDYRELVRYVIQHGQPQDHLLAIFPWQVGYWRSYAVDPHGRSVIGPCPLLLGSHSLEWGDEIRQQVDGMLAQPGALWFPAPLGLGSDLPAEIEAYLQQAAESGFNAQSQEQTLVKFDEGWANPTTFLTGWRHAAVPQITPANLAVDPVALAGVGIGVEVGVEVDVDGGVDPVASANHFLPILLKWDGLDQIDPSAYQVTLRLTDQTGRTWAQRDYGLSVNDGEGYELSGLVVPAGLVPRNYTVALGLRLADRTAGQLPLTTIGQIDVAAGDHQLSAAMLPIEAPLPEPTSLNGITVMGSSGMSKEPALAGTEIPLRIHVQNETLQPQEQLLYVSLLDENGAGVAGWEQWPLPDYPLTQLAKGALLQLPAELQLPATVPSGQYQLISGFINAQSNVKSAPVELGVVDIVQREANFGAPAIESALSAGVARFGNHADLLGYTVISEEEQPDGDSGGTITVHLHWQVAQTLLPPHHIFVHLAEQGSPIPLAQHDNVPMTLTGSSIPTGSWPAGEYFTTQHVLEPPSDFRVDGELLYQEGRPLELRVGLYVPSTGVRLPVSVNGEIQGDYVVLE